MFSLLQRIKLALEPAKLTDPSEEPWRTIVQYWRRSGITIRPGVSMAEVEAFQAKYGVAVPADVLAYLLTVDGNSDGETDDELIRFWPFGEIVPVHKELDEQAGAIYPDHFAYPDCFVFADYLIESWLYVVKLTADPEQPAPVYRVTADGSAGDQMSASFREFMENYAAKPSSVV